jgi:uncharacterized protein
LNKPFKSSHPVTDGIFLGLGAYISGTSLIGAPLIMTVYMVHVACEKLRDTLFVLWFWFEISYAIIEAYGNK